jgi:hypothetical protein
MHNTDGVLADGILRKAVIVVVFLPFLVVGFNCVDASPQALSASPPHVSLGDSVLVAGVFQYIDVTVPNAHGKICIIAFCGETPPEPSARSPQNYYQWEYDHGVWSDESGYASSSIDASNCYMENSTYSFYIKISNTVRPGSWTIEVLLDDQESSSTSLKMIIGDFCLFFSTILGVFEPPVKQKSLFAGEDLRCCAAERKMEAAEENVDKMVDTVLQTQLLESNEEKSMDKSVDFTFSDHNSLRQQEPLRTAVSQYPRSKLKTGYRNQSNAVFFKGNWGGGKDFRFLNSTVFQRIFMIVLLFLLMSVSLFPLVVFNGKNDSSGDITVINVQSYPLVGGEWRVIFTTVGEANLTITAVNGTTWSNSNQECDLQFLGCRRGNETLDYLWSNDSVFIPHFSSNETCYEISKVLQPGVHTLVFLFGTSVAFAHNLASENWLQTSTGDFNNGTKTNITVSSGSFHIRERYYLRNFTRINNEGFEGSWPPTGWSESPSGSNWNRESDRAYEGTYSADFDGTGGSGGASGNLLSPSLNCAGSNVTAIYVKFWGYSENADSAEYYLDYYDGSNWDQITRLDNFGHNAWAHYSQKIVDPQYFKSNFQIRWRVVGLNNNEHVYVDLVNVTVERNESGYYATGNLLSPAHDTTRTLPDYNNIMVNKTTPTGTSVTTWVKAADTQANLSTATWYTAISQVPQKRWVQWRINLTGTTYVTPSINEVNVTWTYDNEYPISTINDLSPYWQTATPFQIEAIASDNGTGIKEVALYYNYSGNNASGWSGWTRYGTNDTTSPYAWSFTPPHGDGYYRFYSRAVDRELNIETPPSPPGFDAFCGVDTVKPSSRLDNITPYWYVEPNRQVIINCSTFSDSISSVKSIMLYYRYRTDNASVWGSWLSFGSDEATPWSWTFNFPKAKGYYQFYSIAVDHAGNAEDPPSSPAYDTECAYNSTKPYSEVNAISPYWHSQSSLTITGQATDFNGSGLYNVTLYYYYSPDNNTWSSSNKFSVDTDPWVTISWDFTFPFGSGYYRFYSLAYDNDSNQEYFTGNDTVCGCDGIKPSSQVDAIPTYWHNTTSNPLVITVTNANDGLSGVKNITLYYRYRRDNSSSWGAAVSFSSDENAPWSWSFNFPGGEGHYRFYSEASDYVGNREDPPSSPEYDTQCGYDTSQPSSQVNYISPYNVTVSPFVLSATASDDVKNVTLWYYYSSKNSSWWNPNWQYRKQLNITGKNGGYQMKIIIGNSTGGNVNCNGHAKSNFGDVRFVSFSDNATLLSYWLKNYTAGTQATFWVNNSRNDTSIWLYYGNRNASTTSSGDSTFNFFDDFSNGLSKWVMDSWNTDSISVNQSQGNPGPALKHLPDNSIPGNRTYQDTRIRTATYKMLDGTIEYDVYIAGNPRIIYQLGWRVNSLSWTNGYCWRLQTSNGDGGFLRFTGPTSWTNIGTSFPDAAVNTWYHVQINVSGANYAAVVSPPCGGASTRSVTDSTKLTADYLVSHVHGVSMDSTNYVLVDNIFVRKYRATPPTWGSFGAEQQGYVKWNNGSNPDVSFPWSWNFNFPNGYGYYWFYSIAVDLNGNKEDTPNAADARCRYITPVAPVINSYDLRNSSGSKLDNVTGLLDVNKEYYFTINVTAKYGWVYVDYIDIKAWYDEGTETTLYNQTTGGNLNMYLRYENITGNASFQLLWPDDEAQLVRSNCTQTIVNSTTRIVDISFKPLSQMRWACSNNTWDATKNTTNDLFSWNFNITVIDSSGLKSWKRDEYGIYKYAAISPEKNWVDVQAPPGYNATTNIVNVTYSSNYDFNISIYFEENLTNGTSGDIIPIADNVYICANADLTDDITTDRMFHGIREVNAIDIINASGIFHKNNTSQVVHVQFNVYIPFGTNHGEYTAHVATKIKQKEQ